MTLICSWGLEIDQYWKAFNENSRGVNTQDWKMKSALHSVLAARLFHSFVQSIYSKLKRRPSFKSAVIASAGSGLLK
jgi:hypothetical protein